MVEKLSENHDWFNCKPFGNLIVGQRSTQYKEKCMQHTTFNKSVNDLIVESANGKINANPIGQRPAVSEGWGKAKGIIESLIKGYSIGSITLRDIRNDDDAQKVYPGTEYLVIDGGHRIRAIKDFNNNKFDVNGLRYIDLPDEVQQAFDDIAINITTYVVNNKQATEIFRRLNTVTPVNPIEMIMSNDTSQFAKEIRSRVSFYPEYVNTVHPLFDAAAKNDKAPKPLNWATDVNPRRKWDEYVAVIMIKVINGGNATAGLDVVAEYVEEDAPISKSKSKLVDRFLDDALKVRDSVSRKFNTDTFSALQLVWFALLEKNKNFKIENFDAFAKEFFKAHTFLTGNAVNKFDTEVRKFKINATDKKERIVKEFARRAIKNFANKYNQQEVAALYLDLMHIANVVTFRDDVRSVSRDKKFEMLANQNFLCAIDGLPLEIDDAIFGHDTPWSKGGLSDDAVIIREEHNKDMGVMTISEYKAYLEFKTARESMTV
jgi:hypothetical protein